MASFRYSCLIFAILINEGIACCFPEKGEGYFRYASKKGTDQASSVRTLIIWLYFRHCFSY